MGEKEGAGESKEGSNLKNINKTKVKFTRIPIIQRKTLFLVRNFQIEA